MEPLASVVVPTRDRRDRLARLLAALGDQEHAPPFEVIVVDDASVDDTDAWLRQRHADPFVLTVLRQPVRQGAAAARNRGWRVARAPIVCFTDDDCRPDPRWLSRLVGAFSQGSGMDLVQGRTIPDPDDASNRGPFSRTMVVTAEQGFYETCNVAYRRSVLEALGGFDESFRYPYGEDTDLAWRARRTGAKTTFVDDAVVRHAVWPSDYPAHLRDMPRREGLVLLYRKHPILRRHFGRRVLFREVHGPTLGALSAIAALALRPRAKARWVGLVVAGAWYAWVCHLVRPHPARRWQWVTVVPLAFLADTYEVAVMARASLRYRTLLL